mmetsp:Transcript_25644/g.39248  ORF Transcript_25644/g.39248 Transcript_25644/m.39248 type:complete len:319 (-) Transcript_25644:207-1163(-)
MLILLVPLSIVCEKSDLLQDEVSSSSSSSWLFTLLLPPPTDLMDLNVLLLLFLLRLSFLECLREERLPRSLRVIFLLLLSRERTSSRVEARNGEPTRESILGVSPETKDDVSDVGLTLTAEISSWSISATIIIPVLSSIFLRFGEFFDGPSLSLLESIFENPFPFPMPSSAAVPPRPLSKTISKELPPLVPRTGAVLTDCLTVLNSHEDEALALLLQLPPRRFLFFLFFLRAEIDLAAVSKELTNAIFSCLNIAMKGPLETILSLDSPIGLPLPLPLLLLLSLLTGVSSPSSSTLWIPSLDLYSSILYLLRSVVKMRR